MAEYWIVNVLDRRVEVCRGPTPESQARYSWAYRNVGSYATGDQVSPLALPRATVPVADLVPDTGRVRGRTLCGGPRRRAPLRGPRGRAEGAHGEGFVVAVEFRSTRQ